MLVGRMWKVRRCALWVRLSATEPIIVICSIEAVWKWGERRCRKACVKPAVFYGTLNMLHKVEYRIGSTKI